MIFKFYLPKNTINDATQYYSELIIRAIENMGHEVKIYNKVFSAENDDVIVTIRPGDFNLIGRKNSKNKICNWFQGIGPEEYVMLHGRTIRSFIMKKYLESLENRALKKSSFSLFVSEAMKNHYEDKYNLTFKNYCIIPCYNKKLKIKYIENNPDRYLGLNFVYAGGLFAWQCIDKTLKTFKEIESIHPEATLTLLTKDTEQANKLIRKYSLKNVYLNYVTLDNLDQELSKYKYGFLLRENIIVNNVSTPTKMNSYISTGIIPIYTNVIESFEQNIFLGDFAVKVNTEDSPQVIADKILEHHLQNINIEKLKETFSNQFKEYYCDEKYINLLQTHIEKI